MHALRLRTDSQFMNRRTPDWGGPASGKKRLVAGVVLLVVCATGGQLAGCSSSAPADDCGTSLEPWLAFTAQEVNTATRMERTATSTGGDYELVDSMMSGTFHQSATGLRTWAAQHSDCKAVAPVTELADKITKVTDSHFADPAALAALVALGEDVRTSAGVSGRANFFPDGGSAGTYSPPPST